MNPWKLPGRRTLVIAVMVGVLGSLGAAATLIAPDAQAIGGSCETLTGYSAVAGSHITVWRYRFCGETEIPLQVNIKRYLSPGVWQTVASGTGEATYYCNGSLYNRYKALGVPEFAILCG